MTRRRQEKSGAENNLVEGRVSEVNVECIGGMSRGQVLSGV